ncbi:helix-turn-helix transcriptional regulator [Solitalea lacus]|uniref:helix-turn-helix transcriptional regulator n=1 Tax=Solitalea lacus TaxID=2911172 RepID=UPI001EDB61B2|nr:YafY family protein [Solitalea lacus]UKJ07662.1 YafY family transcriptional regulator [Solitalea lacus]
MNRIDRISAILIHLQSKKVVKAQDIADRFDISLRTVYRDIKTLEEAGVPLIGEAGIGYSIVDGYRLPPVMFTKEEATAFLTAEKLIEKFTDTATASMFKSAMYKVRAVLKSSEKDLLEAMEGHIEVLRKHSPFHTSSLNNTLQNLLNSIAEKKVVQLEYRAFASTEKTIRLIEPVGIFYSNGYWHTIAYCRLRDDYRDFRADRILKLNITDEVFNNTHPTLKSYFEQLAREENLEKVVINLDKQTAKYLTDVKYYYGFVSENEHDDFVQMTFLTSQLELFTRWFSTFADRAEIVYPEILKTHLKDHLERVAKKLS